MKKLLLNLMICFATTAVFSQNSNAENVSSPINGKKVDCCSSKIDDSDLFKKNKEVIYLNGEFLYWTATCKNREYAFEYDKPITTSGTYYGLGHYVFSKSGWDPGFRTAIGWFYAQNTYQVIGQFTWIRIANTNSIHQKNPNDKPICATFPQFNLGMNQLVEAKSKIKMYHELGDFFVSRVWFPNLHFRLRLFGGLTGGKIQQKWDVVYTDVTSQNENVYNKWKFTGLGLRLGLDIDWFWTNYFYFTGKMSLAPLIGKYDYLGQINGPNNVQHAHFKYDQYRGAYNVQAYLGPSYQRAFCKNRFELFVGYELNSWFNVHEKIINSSVSSSNYLNTEEVPSINCGLFLLHGLTSRLTVDF
jgi:hypothetical protein